MTRLRVGIAITGDKVYEGCLRLGHIQRTVTREIVKNIVRKWNTKKNLDRGRKRKTRNYACSI